MIKKVGLLGLGLAIAAGGPAVFFSAPDFWSSMRAKWFAPAAPTTSAAIDAGAAAPVVDLVTGKPVPHIEGAPVADLSEVFHFNVTREWIIRRWPHVTAGLAHLDLQGFRVPLVSGTDEGDLAGSLTYYFNAQQRVQRITFHGTTGDARKIVGLVGRYGFVRRLTNDPALFVYEAASPDGRPSGVLKIQSAGMISADKPYGRYDVDLIMERPS